MYLNVHSQYSLRYGTLSIENLIDQAKALGIEQMALTDINNSTGATEFIRNCHEKGLKAITGIEFRRDNKLLYIGIARNREGMKELNDFLSFYNLNSMSLPDCPWEFQQAYIIYPYSQNHPPLKENEFLGIPYRDLGKLFGRPLTKIQEKIVALQPVSVSNKLEHRLHIYLRGIELNTILSKIGESDQCHEDEILMSPEKLKDLYSSYPFIIQNTEKLMNDCISTFEKGSKNRKTFTGYAKDDKDLLEKLALEGMEYRYGRSNREALKRVKKELEVIDELHFSAYFLITWDIIRYSMARGYYHIGRGSGANSIVSYCLRITDVDPIELDLYFERFLNRQRSSPPDFDIDYSWDEREDVQDYIFKRYGAKHTALLGTMSTFKDRSIIREIGKVMGLPRQEIDSFTDPTRFTENRDNPTFKKILAIQNRMQDMPNQRSIHAGGVLISEEPITYYTALDLPPKGMPVVQWDMYEAEAIGYEKFDILSQRGIGHIKEAIQLIAENQQKKPDIHDVKSFMKDPKVNAQLKRGDTIGCFYIESPAMRQLIRKLGCENYITLVAASSIIRPGVASSGMMKTYIQNYHDPENVKYLHPVMKEYLEETYGVMVYQEDVIKVCYHYAGLDLTDADVLRRGMSGKYRSKKEFDRLVQRFFDRAKEIGRDEEITKEVWRQVSSFAGYSFSKAHSASFAVESYQSLFLKTYFPLEFMVAVLNNYGGFYQRWLYVHELKKAGEKVHLPCVNNSEAKVCIRGTEAWLGFIGVQGLESQFIELIPAERKANGPYRDLGDFIKRTSIHLEQAIILIRLGALRFTGNNKKELLWEVHNYLGSKTSAKQSSELFHTEAKEFYLPELESSNVEDAYNELELLGFPLTMDMFDLVKTSYRGNVMANDLNKHIGKTIRAVGNYVCEKPVRTKNNKKMWFGTFLDIEGNFMDTVHFPLSSPSYPFRGKGCYLIEGKVVDDNGSPSIDVKKFAKLGIRDNPVF
jgi:DNA polymerase-3 subunit alpha